MEEIKKAPVNFLCDEDIFWKARYIIKKEKRKTMTAYFNLEFEKIIDKFEEENWKLDWKTAKNSLNKNKK